MPMLKMWNKYKQQFAPNIRILASIIYCSEIQVSKALSNFTLGWIMWMKSRVISLKKGTIISFNEMTHKSVGQFALISLETSYLNVLKSFSPLQFF